jgi:ribonuclease P protein component
MVDNNAAESVSFSPIGIPEVYNEENLSTQKEDPQNRARIFQAHVYHRRTPRAVPSTPQGSRTPHLLSTPTPFRPRSAPRFSPQGQVCTLKKSRQFDRVFKHGRPQQRDGLVLYAVRSNHRGLRIGFCVSSKVGDAVTRNRLRRQLREVIRLQTREFVFGYDCVVLARPSVLGSEFQKLRNSFTELGRRIGVLAQAERSRKERTGQGH